MENNIELLGLGEEEVQPGEEEVQPGGWHLADDDKPRGFRVAPTSVHLKCASHNNNNNNNNNNTSSSTSSSCLIILLSRVIFVSFCCCLLRVVCPRFARTRHWRRVRLWWAVCARRGAT